jgi:type II secretory pathway pseudopilin PulG
VHQARRHHAFSTLELLTAIAIIAILAGILLLGTRSLLGGGKARATKVTLASLSGMLAEMDAKKQFDKPPTVWLWVDSAAASPKPPEMFPDAAAGIDFWRTPFIDPNVTNTIRRPDAMDAPGQVSADTGPDRHASRAIINTQIVMQRLLSMPPNRAALQQISQELQFTPEYATGNVRSPGADHVIHSDDDEMAVPPTEPIYYLAGARVTHKYGTEVRRFLCTVNGVPSSADPASSPQFVPDTTQGAPLLLDGWQNPIIFVPGTGLRVRKIGSKSELVPSDKEQTVIVTSPEGKTGRDTATGLPTVVQVGRPFFASAGPDGDFATGDDNIYSFEP